MCLKSIDVLFGVFIIRKTGCLSLIARTQACGGAVLWRSHTGGQGSRGLEGLKIDIEARFFFVLSFFCCF